MDGNRDDAERCLHLAASALSANDTSKAQRLLDKSCRMYPLSDQQAALQAAIDSSMTSKSSSFTATATTTSSSSHPETDTLKSQSGDHADEKPRQPTEAMLVAVRSVQRAKDHYQVLGIARDADEAVVKKAYKKLALRLHPDRNCAAGAEAAFKRVSGAYLTLSNVDRRTHYDRFGEDVTEGGEVFTGLRRRRRQGRRATRVATPFGEFVHVGGDVSAEELFEFLFRAAGDTAYRDGAAGERAAEDRRNGGTDGMVERIRPWLYLLLFVVLLMVLKGEQKPAPFSLERTRYHEVKRVSQNGVTYYTTREVNSVEGRRRRDVERMVDRSALERLFVKCEQESLQQGLLLQQSKRWLIGKKERAKYREAYEKFQKPWCAEAMRLRDSMRQQGYLY